MAIPISIPSQGVSSFASKCACPRVDGIFLFLLTSRGKMAPSRSGKANLGDVLAVFVSPRGERESQSVVTVAVRGNGLDT